MNKWLLLALLLPLLLCLLLHHCLTELDPLPRQHVPQPGHGLLQHLVVVGEVERQTLGDSEQAGRFLRQVRRAAIGSAHDQGEFFQGGVVELVLSDEGIEA